MFKWISRWFTKPKKKYDGYTIGMGDDMDVYYQDKGLKVNFGFSPGAEEYIVIYREPIQISKQALTQEIDNALEKVVDHFISVGYEVKIW